MSEVSCRTTVAEDAVVITAAVVEVAEVAVVMLSVELLLLWRSIALMCSYY